MEETVARGVIDIEARDEGALASLRRVDREFDRTMHSIDGKEAEVRIKGNLADLKRSLKEAEAEVKAHNAKIEALEEKRANAVGGKKGALTREINQRKEIISQLNQEINSSKQLQDSATRHYDSLRRTNQERSIATQREKEIGAAIKRNNAEVEKGHRMEQKAYTDRVRALQLQREFAKLSDRAERLNKRNAFGREATVKLELDKAEVFAQMEAVKFALNRMGKRPPVGIETTLNRRGLDRVKGAFTDVMHRIGNIAGNIPDMAVRLGPFTTSVKGLVGILAVLGPTLVDVGGALTSLVGVLGTGLTGAAAVAGGTMAGLVLNLAGVKESLNPMIGDFKIATQTTLAYHKAVLKYGAASDQAKTAQDQMNNALKGMDPRARAASQSVAALGVNWQKLTAKESNKGFLDVVNQYAHTMQTLQPTLARNTNRTVGILDERLSAMLTKLRTPGAIRIFDSLGKSANNFLNPALDGLQHLGAYLGRIAESAARLFAGPLGNAFKNWARDLDAANPAGSKLDGTVRRLGNHARDLGRFFLSLGRLIVTVLNGSADAGDGLLVSMTKTMDKWNEMLSSAQGQHDMADFFNRSADGARTLYHTFAPLIAEFVRWASYLSPFVTGFLKGVNAVSKVIGKVLELTHLGGSVSTFAATLGALWAVGRIGSFIAMVTRAITAVRTLGAVTTASSLATGTFGAKAAAAGVGIGRGAKAAQIAEDAALARGATRAAPAAERVGASAAGAAPGVSRFGGALRMALPYLIRFGGPAAIAAGAAVAFGGSAKSAADKVHELNRATRDIAVNVPSAGRASVAGFNAIADGTLSLKSANQSVAQAQREVNRLTNAGKQNTPQYTTALQNLNSALDQRTQAERQSGEAQRVVLRANAALQNTLPKLEAAQKAYGAATRKVVPDLKSMIDLHQDVKGITGKGANQLNADDLLKYGKALKPIPGYEDEWAAALKELRVAHAQLASAQGNTKAAQDQFALATVNAKRAIGGLKPMTVEAAGAIRQLNASIGSIKTAKIAMKFPDPRQARQVMQSMNSAIDAGAPKNKVFNVAANSSSAEQAIRRINSLKLQAKQLKIRVDEGDALIAIARLRGVKLSPKTLRLLHEGEPSVIGAVRKILGIHVPPKTLVMLGNMADAARKAGIVNAIKFATKVATFAGKNATASALGQAISAGLAWAGRTFLATFGARHKKAGGGPVAFAGGGDGVPRENSPLLQATIARAEQNARLSERSQGKFNKPTLLVGEENRSEYVIATNPAYRGANIGYLAAAASDLGYTIEPAVTGKAAGKKKKPKKPGASRPGDRRLPPQLRDYVGDVDLSDLQDDVQKAQQEYDDYKQKRDGVISDNKTRKKGHKKHVPDAGKQRRLLARYKSLNAYLASASKEKKNFEDLETRIDTLRTAMDEADKSPSGKADFEGRMLTFDELRKTRKGLIDDRTGKLTTAVNDVNARNAPGTKWLAALRKALGMSRLDAIDNDSTRSTPEQDAADAAQSAADTAKQAAAEDMATYGFVGGQRDLDTRLAALEVARMDNVPDDPATIYTDEAMTSAQNDLAPAQQVASFWADTVKRLQSDPNADPAKLGAAASAYRGAMDDVRAINDTLAGVGSNATTVAAQGAILSSARQDLYQSMGSNFNPVWTQPNSFPSAANMLPGPGAFGQSPAAYVPQGTVVNQTINMSTPPPDPHTWSQGVAWELQAAV